jgi:hypothetical protein
MVFDLWRTFTNLCKRCTGSSRFRAFREDRILVAEEGIPHEIQERHLQQSF